MGVLTLSSRLYSGVMSGVGPSSPAANTLTAGFTVAARAVSPNTDVPWKPSEPRARAHRPLLLRDTADQLGRYKRGFVVGVVADAVEHVQLRAVNSVSVGANVG